MKEILLFDFCNFEDYQIGGHLTFARNLMSAFGDQLSLIGISTDTSEPLGKWFKKGINGIDYNFFALARYSKDKTRHFIPDRIACYLLIRYYKRKILGRGFLNVFVQRPEILPAINDFEYKNICYCFPGTENPMKTSKYLLGKYMASIFDRAFFSSLKKARLILASADENAILNMIHRSRGALSRESVIQFPTRINTEIFKPADKHNARLILNLSLENKVVITVGRLSWLKGWKFMIDSFIIFREKFPESRFYLIGDGEDRDKIVDYIAEKGLMQFVILVGSRDPVEVALYLNASDLFIMGSYKEGWSTSLMEAVACGIPVCTTDFSAASDIVTNGVEGYVVTGHDIKTFSENMSRAINLTVRLTDVSRFSISGMKDEILRYWKLYL